jgi:hypothetical protein
VFNWLHLVAFLAATILFYLAIVTVQDLRRLYRRRNSKKRGIDRAVRCMFIIDKIRESEGWSVELMCDNPDFEGPECAVEVHGEWCGEWCSRRFYGPDLLSVLCTAYAAYQHNADNSAGYRATRQ